jgi:hypothetical protein
MEILLRITAVGDATTFSNVKFTVYDGTNTVDLTATVDGSSTVVGSKFIKNASAVNPLIHIKADQVRVAESAFNRPFEEVFLNAKPAVDNFIQFSFTGDAATDITADCYIRWVPTCSNGSITVV